jgi:hypothetical protein
MLADLLSIASTLDLVWVTYADELEVQPCLARGWHPDFQGNIL